MLQHRHKWSILHYVWFPFLFNWFFNCKMYIRDHIRITQYLSISLLLGSCVGMSRVSHQLKNLCAQIAQIWTYVLSYIPCHSSVVYRIRRYTQYDLGGGEYLSGHTLFGDMRRGKKENNRQNAVLPCCHWNYKPFCAERTDMCRVVISDYYKQL